MFQSSKHLGQYTLHKHLLIVFFALYSFSTTTMAQYPAVVINGQVLTPAQVSQLEQQLGSRIAPGQYLVNFQNSCWANLTNNTSGCLNQGGSVTTHSRYGSGESHSNDDWSYYSNLSGGGGVGGAGDGCVYAFGWSNC